MFRGYLQIYLCALKIEMAWINVTYGSHTILCIFDISIYIDYVLSILHIRQENLHKYGFMFAFESGMV